MIFFYLFSPKTINLIVYVCETSAHKGIRFGFDRLELESKDRKKKKPQYQCDISQAEILSIYFNREDERE